MNKDALMNDKISISIERVGDCSGIGEAYNDHIEKNNEEDNYPRFRIESLDALVGETISSVDIFKGQNQRILLTMNSGRRILIHHKQECCEEVLIEEKIDDEEFTSNWAKIAGKCLIRCTKETIKFNNTEQRTSIILETNSDTVVNKWFGTSNGYYSLEVSVEEVIVPFGGLPSERDYI